MTSSLFTGVIFDIGGVVLQSPFLGIARYENEHGIPPNYLNCSIMGRGEQGAWQRFERGELSLFAFYKDFGQDLSDTRNGNVWYAEYCKRKGIKCPQLPTYLNVNGRDLFGQMMRSSATYDPYIRVAIQRLRGYGRWKIIALTNNFSKILSSPTMSDPSSPDHIPAAELEFLGWKDGATPKHLVSLFDDFCDSSVMGMRKPDPAFFMLACQRNGLKPREVVFLDDIGINLKSARKLGMETIHVPIGGSLTAVKKMGNLLGVDLTNGDMSKL